MSKLRRYYSSGNTYFITMVTHERRQLFPKYAPILQETIAKTKSDQPFDIIAWSIMPDHIHCILNPCEHDLSNLIRRIKLIFSYHYRKDQGNYRGKVLQSRFWDHVIRDGNDMKHHLDYIHYNPVKHGLVKSPFEWKESSIHEYQARGMCQADWGNLEELDFQGEYGE